ncbi:MAG: urease accessory protein UreE [Candidatus Anaerobiospirillum merdipullorum]|uniref:Urease accessory protein UreE n=1 Tax=Candidatus Anaerobiospirillum merdipullorum TaxID=2838450 RepID=A0A9E2NS33_9GAMM|nr:urease accessory protein UreE [Candidatus Anaerobiospirillum merdipullorum]
MIIYTKNLGPVIPTPDAPSLSLSAERWAICRQRTKLEDGTEVGINVERGQTLHAGDVLQSADGQLCVICAAPEELIEATAPDALTHARACYHLGNRHLPLQILPLKVRFLPDSVIEQMCTTLGLSLTRLWATFNPESGAYAHHHEHEHEHHHD